MAVLGLDIGSDTIKVVEMASKGRGTFLLLNYGITPTPPGAVYNGDVRDPDMIGEAIRQLLATRKIKSRQVVSSVQGQQSVVVRIIELPRMSPKELGETMRFEVERHIPFAASQIIMDYAVLNRPGEAPDSPNMEVLFAAAQEEMINVHVDALKQAKLKPKAIDVQPLALSRSMVEYAGNGRGAVGETVAVVNIGAQVTDLSIIKDGILHFPRTIPIGGRSITQRLSEGLGVSEQQAERLKRQYASMKPMPRAARPARQVVQEVEEEAAPALDFGLDLFESETQDDSDLGFGGGGIALEFVPGGGEDAGPPAIELSDDLDSEGPTFDFGDDQPGGTRHRLAPDTGDGGTFKFDLDDDDDGKAPGEAETEEPEGFQFDFSTEGETAGKASVEGIEFGAAREEESDVTGSGAFDFSVGAEESSIETDLGSTEGSATEVGSSFDLGDLATTDEADESAEFDLGSLGAAPLEVTHSTPPTAEAVPTSLSPEDEEKVRVREVIEPVIQEISDELGRSLDYYRSRYDGAVVDRVILIGGGSRIEGLAEYFEEELGLSVDRGDPLASVTVGNRQLSSEDLQRDAPALAVAVGLAIRELA